MAKNITIDTTDGQFGAYRAEPLARSAPAVVVLHEVFGVNADIRRTCDDLAEHGFIAIAPDLFWRQQPGVDLDVRSDADWQTGLGYYQAYDRDVGVRDISAALRAAAALDGSSGRVGVLGYCLGGLMAFLTAARTRVDAVVAFHGADTERYLDEVPLIKAPLLMHLAGKDEFMPEPARASIVDALAKKGNAQVFTYQGCHHAFSRHNGAHYDESAATLANQRTWSFLAAILRTESVPPMLQP